MQHRAATSGGCRPAIFVACRPRRIHCGPLLWISGSPGRSDFRNTIWMRPLPPFICYCRFLFVGGIPFSTLPVQCLSVSCVIICLAGTHDRLILFSPCFALCEYFFSVLDVSLFSGFRGRLFWPQCTPSCMRLFLNYPGLFWIVLDPLSLGFPDLGAIFLAPLGVVRSGALTAIDAKPVRVTSVLWKLRRCLVIQAARTFFNCH